MNTRAEAAVKKLAKLPDNTVCANCGTTQRHGFSTVCIKYLTFVCNHCKTSHQAISHRCKSITMSTWTEGEVLQLKKHGNAHARNVWLANAPPIGTGGRPKEGDDINVFKRFVVDAYEHKRYYVDAGSNHNPSSVSNNDNRRMETQTNPKQQNVNFSKTNSAKWSASSVADFSENASRSNGASMTNDSMLPPVPVQPPVDLLDFGAFDDSPTDTAIKNSGKEANGTTDFFSASSVEKTVEVFDLFSSESVTNTAKSTADEEFGDFAQANPVPISQAPSTATSFDPFNSSNVPNSIANDFFAPTKPANIDQNQNSTLSFDPFSNGHQPSNHNQMMTGQTQNLNMSGYTPNFNAGMVTTNGTQNIDMFAQVNYNGMGSQARNVMSNHGYSNQSTFSTHQMKTNMHSSFGMTHSNIMQHNLNGQGNNISNNFTSQPFHGNTTPEEKKIDPFAGLGF